MAELVDALGSGPSAGNGVEVRVLFWAPSITGGFVFKAGKLEMVAAIGAILAAEFFTAIPALSGDLVTATSILLSRPASDAGLAAACSAGMAVAASGHQRSDR
jgi:hypothetical protein